MIMIIGINDETVVKTVSSVSYSYSLSLTLSTFEKNAGWKRTHTHVHTPAVLGKCPASVVAPE